jgi:hypothetical protein
MDEPENAADGFTFDRKLDEFGRWDRGKGRIIWLIYIQGFHNLQSEICKSSWGSDRTSDQEEATHDGN